MLSGAVPLDPRACQPCSGVHSTVSMWSVKWVPNPGLPRICATSSSLRGLSEGVISMSSVMGATYLSMSGWSSRLPGVAWLRCEGGLSLETW